MLKPKNNPDKKFIPPKRDNWHIYILRCADRSLYTGITTNLDHRLQAHNLGKASKYTRCRLPVKFIWTEAGYTESSAKKREASIKKLTKQEKLNLINGIKIYSKLKYNPMTLKDLQNWVKSDWEKSSKKKPDPHLQLIFLFEELGEMAEAIRKSSGNKKRKNVVVDLEGEMGDVLIALSTIANHYKIDLDTAIEKTKKKIKSRHRQGF